MKDPINIGYTGFKPKFINWTNKSAALEQSGDMIG